MYAFCFYVSFPNIMPKNEMILTNDNIANVAKFIRSTHYRQIDNIVIFYNVDKNTFDYNITRSIIAPHDLGDMFESVSIKIGSFVYTK